MVITGDWMDAWASQRTLQKQSCVKKRPNMEKVDQHLINQAGLKVAALIVLLYLLYRTVQSQRNDSTAKLLKYYLWLNVTTKNPYKMLKTLIHDWF